MPDETPTEPDRLWERWFARASALLCVTDLQGHIIGFNPAFERSLGWREADFVRSPLSAWVHPKDRKHVEDAMAQLAHDGSISGLECRIRTRNGQYRPLRWTVTIVDRWRIGIAHDTSTRSVPSDAPPLAAQSARQASDVAHDLNNLMTVVLGNSELLEADLKDDPRAFALLEDMIAAAGQATKIADRLLSISPARAVEPPAHDLNTLIRRAERSVRQALGNRISLTLRLGAEPCAVAIDGDRITQVLTDLAQHAHERLPRGRTLTISTHVVRSPAQAADPADTGDYALLRIENVGGPIPGRQLKRLLALVDPDETSAHVGRPKGDIVVDYEAPTGAMMISLWWPAVPRGVTETASEPRPAPSADLSEQTILLVEDERLIRRVATSALQNQGYRVLSVASAEEALRVAHAEGNAIDLLLTDVVLPLLSGPRLAERLASQCKRLVVLFTSAHKDRRTMAVNLQRAQVDFLAKPYTPSQLIDAVARTLAIRRGAPPMP